MPPTSGDVHVNKPLTNISIAYLQGLDKFVASKVFPILPVQKESDRYFAYNKGDLLRSEAAIRADGNESVGMNFRIDNTPNYNCVTWALHHDLSDRVVANADNPLNPERDTAEILTEKLLIRRDQQFVDSYFKTGVWDVDWDGVAASPSTNQFLQWDAASGSHPIVNVRAARTAVKALSGFRPNVGVIGAAVFDVLADHADIIDRVKYTSNEVVTPQVLAKLFDLDELIVADPIVNSAAVGATDSIADIFGKHMLLAYRQPRPALMRPSAGYCFSWAGMYGAGNDGLVVSRYRMDHLKATRIEAEFAWDLKVVASDCAAFLEDCIS